ncbi:MAG TPA: hypothetical protein VHA11_11630 [Bryobacteraceae bacterium]|nr:hypothetical protein [Bryobacteraceae bacterium]
MTSSTTYPNARAAAAMVQPHFARHLAEAARQGGTELPAAPDAATIEAIIDAAFWTSLRREEGYVPIISLAWLAPEHAHSSLRFERPLPLDPRALSRLSPAVVRPGIHLGVWREQGSLCVWGITRALPQYSFALEVAAPGLLVIKHRRGQDSGKFVNVAVLEGDQIKILDRDATGLSACQTIVNSLLGFETPAPTGNPANVLTQLAASMREHRRGGLLLVVPAQSETWRESIVHPVQYSVSPAFTELAGLLREDGNQRHAIIWQDSLRRSVDAIAGLTAVDGATVITDRYDLLAFGAKVTRREGFASVARVLVTEPIEGASGQIVDPPQIGGTRHLAAAQFAHDQRDSIAMAASQDGRFTLFAWSACEEIVQAHCVETLLL